MKHGSLFSGIGGFDLAAQWMGWENVFHCEWNDFGQRVLKYYWPNAISYGDINKTDFIIHRGGIDVLTGGFPCQPFSLAGKRKGTADDRHLWPRMLEVIKEVQPVWVVGENVYGLTNWDGGVVFEQVCADLEREGYEVQPVIIPACAVNAPHRRDRIWIVAHSVNSGNRTQPSGINKHRENNDRQWKQPQPESCRQNEITPNTKCESVKPNTKRKRGECCGEWTEMGAINSANGSIGITPDTQGKRHPGINARDKEFSTSVRQGLYGRDSIEFSKCTDWQDFPTVSPLCDRNDGLSDRLADITFPKWRNESIKAMGNAIVPEVAYEIFKVIEQYERTTK